MNICAVGLYLVQNRILGPLRLELGGCEPPCGCCEQNPEPLAEQPGPSPPALAAAGFLYVTQARGYVVVVDMLLNYTQRPVAALSLSKA